MEKGVTPATLCQVSTADMEKMLAFSNKFCGISVQKKGAIISYPTMAEMMQ